jgi:UDPglucose 6-dehydrogenase
LEITIFGAGHVGLVSGSCLAAIGHRVRVLDVDGGKIARLEGGELPFLEPALDEVLAGARAGGAISFHSDPSEGLPGARVVFICVDTPNGPDGQVDLSSVVAAARTAARFADDGALVVNRSTVPVGTAEYVSSILEDARANRLSVVVNPEFLAEGTAVRDFLAPDRIVIGARRQDDADLLVEVYEAVIERRLPPGLPIDAPATAAGSDPVPVVVTNPPTAELIKYAANAFLAVKVSFINEIAAIAEEVGGDVTEISRAIGLDRRIGPHFLRAGIGWGGSCFPKDIMALQGMAETRGLSIEMLRAANDINAAQRRWVLRKLQQHLKTLVGRRVGLLGLAFKPLTDDLRNAPALEIAAELARMNVQVRAFDPAIKSLPAGVEVDLEMVDGPQSLAHGADALVLVTEWPEFADLDLAQLARAMRNPLLLDGRNFFSPEAAGTAGFTYVGVGR